LARGGVVCYLRVAARRGLRSFPTRRSSDLAVEEDRVRPADVGGRQRLKAAGLVMRHEVAVQRQRRRRRTVVDKADLGADVERVRDRKSTRVISSHVVNLYAAFGLKERIVRR